MSVFAVIFLCLVLYLVIQAEPSLLSVECRNILYCLVYETPKAGSGLTLGSET